MKLTTTNSLLLLLFLLYSVVLEAKIKVIREITNTELNPAIPGVSVQIKTGTSKGAIAGIIGKYSIFVPHDAVIIFSYIGYIKQELLINGKTGLTETPGLLYP